MKFVLAFLLIVLLGGGSYAGYLYFFKFDNMLNQMTVPAAQAAVKPVKSKPVSILLLGLDTRQQTGSLNTDVIMVASFNPKTKSATLVSIPRDTFFKPQGYLARKINAFYSVVMREDKEQALDKMQAFISDYLGIPVDNTIVIDFQTFRDVIDALGGIDVYVDMDMRYVDHADGTDINLKKGQQVLNGKQALDFVRYRKSNMGTGPSSDFDRNQRQQRVLAAIVDKMKSLGGLMKLGEIFDALGNNIKTDIPKSQVKQMLATYIGIDNSRIDYIPLEGDWKSPYTYIHPDSLEKAKKALHDELNGVLPEQKQTPPSSQ